MASSQLAPPIELSANQNNDIQGSSKLRSCGEIRKQMAYVSFNC